MDDFLLNDLEALHDALLAADRDEEAERVAERIVAPYDDRDVWLAAARRALDRGGVTHAYRDWVAEIAAADARNGQAAELLTRLEQLQASDG